MCQVERKYHRMWSNTSRTYRGAAEHTWSQQKNCVRLWQLELLVSRRRGKLAASLPVIKHGRVHQVSEEEVWEPHVNIQDPISIFHFILHANFHFSQFHTLILPLFMNFHPQWSPLPTLICPLISTSSSPLFPAIQRESETCELPPCRQHRITCQLIPRLFNYLLY